MLTTPQHRDGAPGGDGSFGDQFAAPAAETVDDAVHERIVGGAVDLRDRDPVLDRGEHGDLPIGDMPGEDDHAAPRGDRPIDVLDAVRLDAAAGFEHADLMQMRILGRDPAEIVPNTGNDVFDLGFRKPGQGAADVEPGAFGNAEPGTDRAGQRAADRRRPIERQQSQPTKAQHRPPTLQSVSEADRPPHA